MNFKSIKFNRSNIEIIDQRLLPKKIKKRKIKNSDGAYAAIKKMMVRGAPLIGITAAFGFYLALKNRDSKFSLMDYMQKVKNKIISARPTAYNIESAMNSIYKVFLLNKEDLSLNELKDKVYKEAVNIYQEDVKKCKNIGIYMNKYIGDGYNILTHCNAGALATSQYGTALSGIYIAGERNKKIHVWVDETRPWLQGARLTAWELKKNSISSTLIVDSAAGSLIKKGIIDMIIVGADRIAANGDVANKIGTYQLSVLAKEHDIPFFVAAPTTTIDYSLKSGSDIEIEERGDNEIKYINGDIITLEDQNCYNPVFDVTPYKNITEIISERGKEKFNEKAG